MPQLGSKSKCSVHSFIHLIGYHQGHSKCPYRLSKAGTDFTNKHVDINPALCLQLCQRGTIQLCFQHLDIP